MDYLPLEVLNKIAKNRTLYVLAASLTVSVGWRGSCNKNWMWWQHYNADTAEYLEAAECRAGEVASTRTGCGGNTVTRTMLISESEDSTQTCLYKKAGNKEMSIKETLIHLPILNIYNKYKMYNSETGMNLLPLEVLNKIAENRTLYVLAASSSVNVAWREYLETSECWVNPRFESQESEDSTQTSLYKKAGDKEISIYESLLVV
ncbi:hypothetical protein J6590_099224 [Homalodisca vitripennis]|nr:hypothetical protein J6590_086842 [Homalodisca vitripennis]KAG8279701.1 hypothetical protein J6590_099224 [Homalodisca vitripennis]